MEKNDLIKQMEDVRDRFASCGASDLSRAVEQMNNIILNTKNLISEFSAVKTFSDPNLMLAEVIKITRDKFHGQFDGTKHVDIRIDSNSVNILYELPQVPKKIVVFYYKEDE